MANSLSSGRHHAALLLLVFGFLTVYNPTSRADIYLSNLHLDNPPDVVNVETVFYDWRPVSVDFTTGPGSFVLNSITLEFLGLSDITLQDWTNAAVRLFQRRENASLLLLGTLKNPTPNPLPSPRPRFTSFIDFHATKQMILHPLSTYSLEISAPPISSNRLSMISLISSNYTSVGGWRMGPTITPLFGRPSTAFLKLAVDADPFSGSIVPGGITAFRHGSDPSLRVEVIQDPISGDISCLRIEALGRNTFEFLTCLDEGVRSFLVPSNAPITAQTLLGGTYPELKQARVLEPDVPFYVAFYTGGAFATNGIPAFGLGLYTNAVLGWGKFIIQDDIIDLLDSALQAGGGGIHAGTRTIIPPQPPLLHFGHSTNQLRLWWTVAAGDFILQQTTSFTPPNWTDATLPPTLNPATLLFELNLDPSAVRQFYRLRTK